ncbi:MAG: Two-component hybrid sensor and regulator [Phycisphaerales bacterium]|nr:Two-component hybrid sensor and regulator [Phycisphaerales bacterium]
MSTTPPKDGSQRMRDPAITAVVAVALGVVCRLLVLHVFNLHLPYLPFLPFLLGAVLYGGIWAGVLALIGFVTVSAIDLEPTDLIQTSSAATGLLLFCATAACVLAAGQWANLLRGRALQAYAVLRESEERLHVALEAGQMGTWEWTIADGRVRWSTGLEKIHGRLPGTFKGSFEDALSYVHPDDRERLVSAVHDAIARRVDHHLEYRIITAQGRERWVEARAKVLYDEDDAPQRMTGVCMDVTEQREAARLLADANRHFKVLTETVPDFVWSCGADGRVDYLNPQYVEFTGLTVDRVNEKWHTVVHPDDVPKVENAWAASLRYSEPFELEYRFRRAVDGEYRWFLTRTVAVRDDAGVLVRWVGTATDLHEAKMAAEEREHLLAAERAARAEVERASRVKDEFLANLSHELRTPLTPVLLTVALLESNSSLPAGVREDVNTIRRNVELEARLIDDLLDLTRISRGKIKYDFHNVDLHLLVRSAVGICCTDGKLSVQCDLSARHHHVHGDPARLQQVFWNLLNNSWKFTPAGGRLIIRSADAGEDKVSVEVTDTGAGMDPELLPRVFDAFEQGDALHARKFGGLGLGLAICQALVLAHGGTITAHSDGPGKGATFTVELPTAAVMEPSEPVQRPQPLAPVNGEKALKLLLVEDHPATLSVMVKLLGQMGYEVTGAASMTEGLEAAGKRQYDLLISDLGLPDGTGHELMQQVRRMYGIKGIALSGYGMDEDIARSRESGFEEHVVKPVDFQVLQTVIARVTAGAHFSER